jgi:hypothetical protein
LNATHVPEERAICTTLTIEAGDEGVLSPASLGATHSVGSKSSVIVLVLSSPVTVPLALGFLLLLPAPFLELSLPIVAAELGAVREGCACERPALGKLLGRLPGPSKSARITTPTQTGAPQVGVHKQGRLKWAS